MVRMDGMSRGGWPALRRSAVAVIAGLMMCVPAAGARDHAAFAARQGLDAARAAARSWSEDATLVYLENDEALTGEGTSPRWGYLFFSPGSQKSRAYSIRDGRVLQAETLEMDFVAPPVREEWLDSGAAVAAAASEAERAFRPQSAGAPRTMLLARGVFAEGTPDQTNWLLVYQCPGQAALYVVVDAVSGKVRRTWRG